MQDQNNSHLLAAIEALYQAALAPGDYEAFVGEWDKHIAELDPDSEDAQHLLKHIDQAMSILDRLHPISRESFSDAEFVERETGPAAIVDSFGRILTKNENWEVVSDAAPGTLWDIVDDPYEQDALRHEIKSLHEIAEPHSGFARITDNVSGASIGVSVRRLSDAGHGNKSPTYLVRTSHAVWSDHVGDVLIGEFSLTPAEIALVKHMSLGLSFAEITKETGRSPDTLKTQSKAIYRKMNVTGREDVVRVTLQLHLLLQGAAPKRQVQFQGSDQGFVQLKDGRRVAWTMRGAKLGRGFLFLHGMGLGHGMTQRFIKELEKRNLKAICLDRPGYGLSDPPQNWRRTVEEWTESFPIVLDHFDLESATIVSHTSGVLYGCAASAAHPERVSGVCALAGGTPINDPAKLSHYPSQIRILSRTARLSAQALRFVLSSSAAFYRSEKGRQRLMDRTYGGIPSDKAAMKDKEISELIHNGMGLIDSGGYDGFVGDGLRIFSDWTHEVERMQCGLHYVLGEEDPICPVNWAEDFATNFENIRVTPVPKAGQLLHHTHPVLIADIINDMVGNSPTS